MRQSYLLLGEVLKPQGIHGEVKVRHYTDDPARFRDLKSVFVKRNGEYDSYDVLSSRVQNEDVFLKLKGIEDRNQAEVLRGLELWIDREHAVTLDENHIFIADLIGIETYDTAGRKIGTLEDVITSTRTNVYVFHTERGTMMMPALDDVIVQTDIEANRMVLDAERLQEVALYEDSRT